VFGLLLRYQNTNTVHFYILFKKCHRQVKKQVECRKN
jgi:hypothetical protein